MMVTLIVDSCDSQEDDANATKGPFLELPICTYYGHTADILDLSWSKVPTPPPLSPSLSLLYVNLCRISSFSHPPWTRLLGEQPGTIRWLSCDGHVMCTPSSRLWHISRKECLCCFQHVDFVTAIAFHPRVSCM